MGWELVEAEPLILFYIGTALGTYLGFCLGHTWGKNGASNYQAEGQSFDTNYKARCRLLHDVAVGDREEYEDFLKRGRDKQTDSSS